MPRPQPKRKELKGSLSHSLLRLRSHTGLIHEVIVIRVSRLLKIDLIASGFQ